MANGGRGGGGNRGGGTPPTPRTVVVVDVRDVNAETREIKVNALPTRNGVAVTTGSIQFSRGGNPEIGGVVTLTATGAEWTFKNIPNADSVTLKAEMTDGSGYREITVNIGSKPTTTEVKTVKRLDVRCGRSGRDSSTPITILLKNKDGKPHGGKALIIAPVAMTINGSPVGLSHLIDISASGTASMIMQIPSATENTLVDFQDIDSTETERRLVMAPKP